MVISCIDFKKFSHIEMDCIILQLEYIVLGFKDDVSVSCKKQKSKGVVMSLDGINGRLIQTLLRE